MSYLQLFNESYARVALDPMRQGRLIREFAEEVRERTPEVATGCEASSRLDLVLRRFVMQIGAFCATGYTPTATFHRLVAELREHGLSSELLDVWFECLLIAVAKVDPPLQSETEAAWRIALAPSLQFLKLPQQPSSAA